MEADDRILVGVINRRRDFDLLRDAHWYRVPIESAPLCIDTDYLAFYLSAALAKQVIDPGAPGAIYYYARRVGFELVRRRDLLPDEPTHPRALSLYFKLQVQAIEPCQTPIGNPTRRLISFIFTTGERFNAAQVIGDLISPRKRQAAYQLRD